jgi:hypothetical protein
MIADFRYAVHPPAGHVALRLSSSQGAPVARVEPPNHLVGRLSKLGVRVASNDEYIDLALALSLAILAATISGAALTLTGDADAWPEGWGALRRVGASQPLGQSVTAH